MSNRKPLFDTFRRILGRGMTQAEVNAIDDAIDASMIPDAPTEAEQEGNPSRIGAQGIALIKEFEGCHKRLPDGRIAAYPDPGTGNLPITIGWGSTQGFDKRPIPRNAVMTQDEVDRLLERDLASYAAEVAKVLGGAPTSQRQFDALVSFHYNTGAIARATLARKHKAGDFNAAAAEFGRWVNAGGKPMKGLIRRRAAEAALYRAGS